MLAQRGAFCNCFGGIRRSLPPSDNSGHFCHKWRLVPSIGGFLFLYSFTEKAQRQDKVGAGLQNVKPFFSSRQECGLNVVRKYWRRRTSVPLWKGSRHALEFKNGTSNKLRAIRKMIHCWTKSRSRALQNAIVIALFVWEAKVHCHHIVLCMGFGGEM